MGGEYWERRKRDELWSLRVRFPPFLKRWLAECRILLFAAQSQPRCCDWFEATGQSGSSPGRESRRVGDWSMASARSPIREPTRTIVEGAERDVGITKKMSQKEKMNCPHSPGEPLRYLPGTWKEGICSVRAREAQAVKSGASCGCGENEGHWTRNDRESRSRVWREEEGRGSAGQVRVGRSMRKGSFMLIVECCCYLLKILLQDPIPHETFSNRERPWKTTSTNHYHT